jgi:large subunit ribosomal protein L13
MPKTPLIRNRHLIDAEGQALGRLAVRVATLLRGKHKATFEPHKDEGDIVEVKNVSKVTFSGKKLQQKEYHSYSGYPGGLKTKKLGEIFKTKPDDVLRRAVREMLPDNRLRNAMMKRLIIK